MWFHRTYGESKSSLCLQQRVDFCSSCNLRDYGNGSHLLTSNEKEVMVNIYFFWIEYFWTECCNSQRAVVKGIKSNLGPWAVIPSWSGAPGVFYRNPGLIGVLQLNTPHVFFMRQPFLIERDRQHDWLYTKSLSVILSPPCSYQKTNNNCWESVIQEYTPLAAS